MLEYELDRYLMEIDYTKTVFTDTVAHHLGDPQPLFRAMVSCTQKAAETFFLKHFGAIFEAIGAAVDECIIQAYREYVERQDQATFAQLQELSAQTKEVQPFSSTVQYTATNILRFSKSPKLHLGVKDMFLRFVNDFLRSHGKWDAERGITVADVRKQMQRNLGNVVTTFLRVYVFEDPVTASSYLSRICVGGERTLWAHISNHVEELDRILGNQIRITKWRIGLYQNKRFFVSNRPEYQQTLQELLTVKAITESLIIELIWF